MIRLLVATAVRRLPPHAQARARRVSRLSLHVADVDAAVRFYQEALGFRATTAPAPAAAHAPLQRALLGSDGCQLEFFRTGADEEAPRAALSPMLGIAASNLPGTLVKVRRKGGSVAWEDVRDAGAAIVHSPAGHALRLLHAFKRWPIQYAALLCADVAASAHFYRSVAGFSLVTQLDEALGCGLPRDMAAAAAAAGAAASAATAASALPARALGAAAASAPLLCVNRRQLGSAALLFLPASSAAAAESCLRALGGLGSAASTAAAAAAATSAGAASNETAGRAYSLMTIRLDAGDGGGDAVDITAAHACAERLGAVAGPLEAAPAPGGRRGLAFTCLDPDGHPVYYLAAS